MSLDTAAPQKPARAASAAALTEAYLDRWLSERPLPANLRAAMRYSLLGPGKRTRPILTIHSCVAVGGSADRAIVAAAAIEMVHAFSLVHDDLPAMDDDDLRRGRPTLHKHSGEAMAILAGDALLGLAVELVLKRLEPAGLAAAVCNELIQGCNDMIAGQVYDTLPEPADSVTPAERLEMIHRHKTGALIRAACRMGGRCGEATAEQLAALSAYGDAVGHMFQVVDDLIDVTQTTEHLGKTAGKDADQDKLTYPALLGLEGTRREVERLREAAIQSLAGMDQRADPLRELADTLAVRTK
jgi:geranylgeranyl diphosphate synthase type II